MSKLLPLQAHISLRLYGATPEHFQEALIEAFEQLKKGDTSRCQKVLEHQQGGYSFDVTAMNLVDDRPLPAVPPSA
ncbi:hypothetical protein SAMN05216605_121146 [Pseudomonas abietaniphila]|uniref:Uncharacterized protein n=1 Tax=Pseudomonas abietaniphila TaxID=89065 RepID=A0A1G8R2P1_9PSED|nr:hypothetical protein SAMN05216605_121146 [Pseudomonas abietaniphila]